MSFLRRHLQAELNAARAEIQSLQTEKLILQDRLQVALSDRERVWGVMKDSLESKDRALYTQINILMQERYGIAPYDAAKLPENRVPQQQEGGPVRRRMSASEAVTNQTAAFVRDFENRIKEKLA